MLENGKKCYPLWTSAIYKFTIIGNLTGRFAALSSLSYEAIIQFDGFLRYNYYNVRMFFQIFLNIQSQGIDLNE